jgi:hypothetical protein
MNQLAELLIFIESGAGPIAQLWLGGLHVNRWKGAPSLNWIEVWGRDYPELAM